VSVELNQVNLIRAEDEELYNLLEDTHEEVGEALVDIDMLECSVSGVYRALENQDASFDYTLEKVEKILDTLNEIGYLREYSKGSPREYEAKRFTEEDLRDLKREVTASGRKDSYQTPLPTEGKIIPGVDDIS
jgi:hypothetical protein